MFYSFWHLIKLILKVHDVYHSNSFINELPDYEALEEKDEQDKNKASFLDELRGLDGFNNQPSEQNDGGNQLNRTNVEHVICSICLHEVYKGKTLHCGHTFHLECIKYVLLF